MGSLKAPHSFRRAATPCHGHRPRMAAARHGGMRWCRASQSGVDAAPFDVDVVVVRNACLMNMCVSSNACMLTACRSSLPAWQKGF